MGIILCERGSLCIAAASRPVRTVKRIANANAESAVYPAEGLGSIGFACAVSDRVSFDCIIIAGLSQILAVL
jgi:hypothetical protein